MRPLAAMTRIPTALGVPALLQKKFHPTDFVEIDDMPDLVDFGHIELDNDVIDNAPRNTCAECAPAVPSTTQIGSSRRS